MAFLLFTSIPWVTVTAVNPAPKQLKFKPKPDDVDHMDPSSIALQALHNADVQLECAASAIAGTGATSADRANLDVVDLSTEIVALISAQTLFEANLTTLETAAQMHKTLIDTVA
jgi:hypothetical protein